MRSGKISSRPKSIAKDKSTFEKFENPANEPVGPTRLKPGPMLLKHAVVA